VALRGGGRVLCVLRGHAIKSPEPKALSQESSSDMHIFKRTNYDFLKWRWHAIALSWLIIIAGMVTLAVKGVPLGIEFAGGTVVIAQFDQPTSVEQVRRAMDKAFPGGGRNLVVQAYGDPSQRQMMIRVPHVGAESGSALSTTAIQIEDSLRQGGVGSFKVAGTE